MEIAKVYASVDPDKTPRSVAFDLGQHPSVNTVCQCPFNGTLDINRLSIQVP